MHIRTIHLTAVFTLFAVSYSLWGDSILPTAIGYCQSAFGSSGSCSVSATQLPSGNGIQGIQMNVSANSPSSDLLAFQFEIVGALSGDSLPAGTLIPYSFSFVAGSVNAGGTEITNFSFDPIHFVPFPLPPDLSIPPPIVGASVSQSSTITSNGNCIPGLPSGPTNTCWQLSVTGNGMFQLGNVPSGALVEIPLYAEFDTSSFLGPPQIHFSGEVSFNPIPEPRYAGLILLTSGLVFAIWQRRRSIKA